MHDIGLIRRDAEAFDKAMSMRGVGANAARILALDEVVRKLKAELQKAQEQRNKLSKIVARISQEGGKVGEAKHLRSALTADAEENKRTISILGAKLAEQESELDSLLALLPNVAAEDVPLGAGENDNVHVRSHGVPTEFSFKPLQHFEVRIGKENMDFVRAAQMSGSRFVVLKDKLALLERALASYMMDLHTTGHGYVEISPPVLVRDDAMFGVGQLPKFEDESFSVSRGYRLVPTSEVPLTNMVAGTITPQDELPLRFVAHTPCFRAEAGSAGVDTKGMMRLHQFSKVELVSITTEMESKDEHERMLHAAERVLQDLDLAYRVVLLCTQDMGFSAAKTYDLEVWCPAQGKYREVSSCSNCHDFQARRMNARYKNVQTKANHFVHTLNASGLAIGRVMVAILENYQQEDGSVVVPSVLVPYMGGVQSL